MNNGPFWYNGNPDRVNGNWLLVSEYSTVNSGRRWMFTNTAMNMPDRYLLKVSEEHQEFRNGVWTLVNATFKVQELMGLNWDYTKLEWIDAPKRNGHMEYLPGEKQPQQIVERQN